MRLLKTITSLSAASAAFLLSAISGAHADALIDYSFDPSTIIGVGFANRYAVAGTFTYDVDTMLVSNVDVTYTQLGNGPTGPFGSTAAGESPFPTTAVTFVDNCDCQAFTFFFENSLALGGTDPISLLSYSGTYPQLMFEPIPTVGSVSAVPVPEPFTLSLFGAGLAGAAALRRRKKKAT
jgi:hypothetical protein